MTHAGARPDGKKTQRRRVCAVGEPAGTGCRHGAVLVPTGGPQCRYQTGGGGAGLFSGRRRVPIPAQKWSGVRPFGSRMFGLAPICSALINRVQLAACVALSSSSSASERGCLAGRSSGMGACDRSFLILFTLMVTFVSSSSTTAATSGAASVFGFTFTLIFVVIPLLSLLLSAVAAASPLPLLGGFIVIFTLLSLSPSASSGWPVRRQLRWEAAVKGATLCCTRRPVQQWTSARTAKARLRAISPEETLLHHRGSLITFSAGVLTILHLSLVARHVTTLQVPSCERFVVWCPPYIVQYCGGTWLAPPKPEKEERECLPVDAGLLLCKLHGEPRDAAAHLEGQRP